MDISEKFQVEGPSRARSLGGKEPGRVEEQRQNGGNRARRRVAGQPLGP